jgi:hypothetical protein
MFFFELEKKNKAKKFLIINVLLLISKNACLYLYTHIRIEILLL